MSNRNKAIDDFRADQGIVIPLVQKSILLNSNWLPDTIALQQSTINLALFKAG
jgi:hypothetical protein